MAGAETKKNVNSQSPGGQTVQHDGQHDGQQDGPDWASGLKQLYNSVVDEPLPDSFTNLLAQLDGEAGQK